jgi:hypothetical protein
MPLPARVHTTISGTLPGGEVFSTGFDTLGAAGNQATLQSAAQSVADYLQANGDPQNDFRAIWNNVTFITKITCYSYNGGSTSADLQAAVDLALSGNSTQRHANQIALCATLVTGLSGRRHRGRMYWPANGVTVNGADSQAPAAAAMFLARGVAGILKAQGADIQPVVVSRVGQSAAPIVGVRVDTRFDVIRARANQQAPTSKQLAAVA